MATPLTRREWLAECEKLAKVYEDAMTNPKHTDTSRSGDLVDDDFAPIWDESILLAEHEAVQASVAVGGWLSAALDDPNVCDAMKADINRWFSAGFLYLDEVRKIMQAHRIAADLAGYERGQRETVALIVAWLRQCQNAKLNHHAEVCHREDDDVLDAIVTAMNTFAYSADAIEAGEWK